jgi:ABC-type multidrug transport system ATPase subunit
MKRENHRLKTLPKNLAIYTAVKGITFDVYKGEIFGF